MWTLILILLISFLQIGLFSIGGGYATIPLIQEQVVNIHKWLTFQEFTDIITISQMTPGPIAINSATFVGIQVAGFPGAIIATLGCVTPSFIIVISLAKLYFKYRKLNVIKGILDGLRPAVISLIASAGVSMTVLAFLGENNTNINQLNIDYLSVSMFVCCLVLLQKFKVNPIYIMFGSGIIGGILYTIIGRIF